MDVPDEKIVELRQLFFEKLEREGHKVPGTCIIVIGNRFNRIGQYWLPTNGHT